MDRLEQIKQQAEREVLDRQLERLRSGPPESPVEYYFRAERWLRMPRWAAEAKTLAEYAEGGRHLFRTKEAILAFLEKHRIPYGLIADPARDARLDREVHKRMKAAAISRRKRVVRSLGAGRSFL